MKGWRPCRKRVARLQSPICTQWVSIPCRIAKFSHGSRPARYRQQAEEAYASTHGGYAPELQAEMDKVAACDLLIFQFPIWWLGLPAILKGWVDRVFAVGRAYGGGRHFETGVFAGKRALCAVTVGGTSSSYAEKGMYAPIEQVLYPIHHGIFAFTGFAVLQPFVVYAPTRIEERERIQYLNAYRRCVARIAEMRPCPALTLQRNDC